MNDKLKVDYMISPDSPSGIHDSHQEISPTQSTTRIGHPCYVKGDVLIPCAQESPNATYSNNIPQDPSQPLIASSSHPDIILSPKIRKQNPFFHHPPFLAFFATAIVELMNLQIKLGIQDSKIELDARQAYIELAKENAELIVMIAGHEAEQKMYEAYSHILSSVMSTVQLGQTVSVAKQAKAKAHEEYGLKLEKLEKDKVKLNVDYNKKEMELNPKLETQASSDPEQILKQPKPLSDIEKDKIKQEMQKIKEQIEAKNIEIEETGTHKIGVQRQIFAQKNEIIRLRHDLIQNGLNSLLKGMMAKEVKEKGLDEADKQRVDLALQLYKDLMEKATKYQDEAGNNLSRYAEFLMKVVSSDIQASSMHA